MLRKLGDLEGFAIRATDGVIGHVKDFLFDDAKWVIRYLVVETGQWLASRKVLISPISIGEPEWAQRVLPVSITMEQVKNSPDIDTDKPVSRQQEIDYLAYYGYCDYGGGAGFWGAAAFPGAMLTGVGYAGSGADFLVAQAKLSRAQDTAKAGHCNDDPHLRSSAWVMGNHVEATNGGMGHVQGLLIDDQSWAIRYIVVNTSNWWLGHEVILAPRWIEEVRWPDKVVTVTLTREAVKNAPPYDGAVAMDRVQESELYRHHERAGYWADEAQPQNPRFQANVSPSQASAHRKG